MELTAAFQAAPVYAIYDTRTAPSHFCAETIAAWLRAGIRVIQYRHKGAFERGNFADCRDAAMLVREAGGLFIVNDRADVALLSEADGVHVGQEDLAPADVRKLLPGPAIVGHSTHSLRQLSAALSLPIDYVAVGPVDRKSTRLNSSH